MENFVFPKINNIKIAILTLIILICGFSFAYAQEDPTDPNYNSTGWVNRTTAWDGQGCKLNVRNERTRVYCAGIYNRLWPDYVSYTDSDGTYWSIGDRITIDAHTIFQYSWVRVYTNDVLTYDSVEEFTEAEYHHLEDYVISLRITGEKTKIVCTAGGGSPDERYEQLGVTIFARGDNTPPQVSVNPKKVLVGNSVNITLTDDTGVTGYIVKTSSNRPTKTSEWTAVTAQTSRTVSYTPTQEKTYYVWAHDDCWNISEVDTFRAGYLPNITSPSSYKKKEGTEVSFETSIISGTTPITFQWYKATSPSATGTAISRATDTKYTINQVKRDDNDTYYYCVATNDFGTYKTEVGALMVYWPHTLNTVSDDIVSLNKPRALFTVSVNENGNKAEYRYQWYKSNTPTGTGVKISGATESTYSFAPNSNIQEEYYYCVVTNYDGEDKLYDVTSNKAKLVSDVSRPTIEIGTITTNPVNVVHNTMTYINRSHTITIPFIVRDNGSGFTEDGSNFTIDDLEILIGENIPECTKTWDYRVVSEDRVDYTLTLTGIPGSGGLNIRIAEGDKTSPMPTTGIRDNYGNTNIEYHFITNFVIDNITPSITQFSPSSEVTGLNGQYINKDGTLELKLAIRDNYGMNYSEIKASDIVVKIGGVEAASNTVKNISFTKLNGESYIYTLTLSNINGTTDGEISIEIMADKVKDWATNSNAETIIPLRTGISPIIVDNTPPVISNIVTEFNGYGSGVHYPGNLAAWHEKWSKQDIYVTVEASDNYEINYYATSKDQGRTYTKMTSNQEHLISEYNDFVWYRVVDKAGNISENIDDGTHKYRVLIKIDKTKPDPVGIGLFELRVDGVNYTYDSKHPSNRNITIKPRSAYDLGELQSGVLLGPIERAPSTTETAPAVRYSDISSSPDIYVSYYTVKRFANEGSTDVLDEKKYNLLEIADTLIEDGYYEIHAYTTDLAGNEIDSPVYKVQIKKSQSNIVRLTNITDIGSGVGKITIKVFNSDASGNKVSTTALSPIVVAHPEREYETTLRLGRGTFYVEVTIEDNTDVPNTTTYEKKIVNDF